MLPPDLEAPGQRAVGPGAGLRPGRLQRDLEQRLGELDLRLPLQLLNLLLHRGLLVQLAGDGDVLAGLRQDVQPHAAQDVDVDRAVGVVLKQAEHLLGAGQLDDRLDPALAIVAHGLRLDVIRAVGGPTVEDGLQDRHRLRQLLVRQGRVCPRHAHVGQVRTNGRGSGADGAQVFGVGIGGQLGEVEVPDLPARVPWLPRSLDPRLDLPDLLREHRASGSQLLGGQRHAALAAAHDDEAPPPEDLRELLGKQVALHETLLPGHREHREQLRERALRRARRPPAAGEAAVAAAPQARLDARPAARATGHLSCAAAELATIVHPLAIRAGDVASTVAFPAREPAITAAACDRALAAARLGQDLRERPHCLPDQGSLPRDLEKRWRGLGADSAACLLLELPQPGAPLADDPADVQALRWKLHRLH
mmetsp:Transcript_25990/g.77416  ORF Transcript_25990/g.77416 Transcript_25990/m.77416 type:complete len:422 (-) Transcript_25990:374-1639(-)